MNYKIFPPKNCLHEATLALPLSKSLSNRALIVNALSGGNGDFEVARCNDTDAMLAGIGKRNGRVDVGAAGTAMRFLTAYFASTVGTDVVIDGSERMRRRPIGPLVDALRQLGGEIEYVGNEGFPPLHIVGRLLPGGVCEIDGSVSSQFISALMMIAPATAEGVDIRIKRQLTSRPYVDMTATVMAHAGVDVETTENSIRISAQPYRRTQWNIEGDWSAASYWFELVAVGGVDSAAITNLYPDSTQGDSAICSLFEPLGISACFVGGNLEIKPNKEPGESVEMNLVGTPDVAQTIAAACCLCGIRFKLTGLSTLPSKETNRLEAMKTELRKLGFVVSSPGNNSLVWAGETCAPQENPRIRTYDDHRMAMALAPAALRFPGLVVEDIEVVAKSYPGFWKDLQNAGFKIEETE